MHNNILFLIIFIFLVLLNLSCVNPKESDTTPPTVSITFSSSEPVNEIVTITCISTDNKGVEKVELWVNGESTGVIDETEPYKLNWNTTTYEDGSYIITVRSYDTNGNTTDSNPITLVVNNSVSYPQSVSIISILFGNGSFTITWNQSPDSDFISYVLEKSDESTMNNYIVIYSTENVTETTYLDSDVDPLSYQYYRITVIDTFGYETKGQIVSSLLDPSPTPVNVISVTYTLEEMTVNWQESPDGDFRNYKLLFSETESGNRDTLVTYTDKSTTSHIITEFDPTHENWYWIIVSDTLGQSTVGNGMRNEINSPPTQVELNPIVYEDGSFIITWSENNDEDFASYELYESFSPNMINSNIIYFTNNSDDLTFILPGIGFDEFRYYQIVVSDIWNQETASSVERGSSYPKIVFTSNRLGKNDIFIMDIDGINQKNLTYSTQTGFHYSQPYFSPDGSKIVFSAAGSPNGYVYIMNIDGTNQINLTISLQSSYNPQFSPDGSKIIFQSYLPSNEEIYIMNNDGSNQVNLTNHSFHDQNPQFSPDMSKIVFESLRDNNYEIYIMSIDGNNQIRLTNNQTWDANPQFSPDGSTIVYESGNIYKMNNDGSNKINLTNSASINLSPSFSPDGSKIVFESRRDDIHHSEIYIMDNDGSNQIRLTYSSEHSSYPKFSPDGTKIIFISERTGNWEIYLMDIDGSNQVNLTNNVTSDGQPQIQPRN